MRSFGLMLLLVVATSACQRASDKTDSGPRREVRITCFIGKADSGSKCSSSSSSSLIRCGTVGKLSEIGWAFVGRKGDGDVYEFTRKFPAEEVDAKTTKKRIEFAGKRITVFEDEFHCVVIDARGK
jgi:hypothetical protein